MLEFPSGSLPRLLSSLIIQTLLFASVYVWVQVLRSWRQGPSLFPAAECPRWTYPPPAVGMAWGWVAFLIWSRWQREFASENEPADLPTVMGSLLLTLIVWGLLFSALAVGNPTLWQALRGTAASGIDQLRWGGWGYLIAIGPTFLLAFASARWRGVETQHSYLLALERSPSAWLLILLVLSAVVAAPLAEELLFRVTLQGWLRQWLGGPSAVLSVAVLFASIHGWRDAPALLPLSLTLGLLYERHQSYLAVCTTHGLFNGVMLLLQWLKVLDAST
jgi:membrane protease YdiL (CAAX protease family)